MRMLRATAQPSYARVEKPEHSAVRVGAVQLAWHADPAEHRAALAEGIRMAAAEGVDLVCLQELTLSPYFAITPDGPGPDRIEPEPLETGPTMQFAATMAAETGVLVHASLYEDRPGHRLGYNTAIVVGPDGELRSRTRKLHIPVTAGYYEDRYFAPGPADRRPIPHPSHRQCRRRVPDVLGPVVPGARARVLAGRGSVLVFPTAIGSEPDHPEFDTEPLWEKVIVANGIANGMFMIAVNRIGTEPPITFYGSSFISDPYGRILVQAPRDEPAVLVADLDIDERRDWLSLFPLLTTRRPDAYGSLTD